MPHTEIQHDQMTPGDIAKCLICCNRGLMDVGKIDVHDNRFLIMYCTNFQSKGCCFHIDIAIWKSIFGLQNKGPTSYDKDEMMLMNLYDKLSAQTDNRECVKLPWERRRTEDILKALNDLNHECDICGSSDGICISEETDVNYAAAYNAEKEVWEITSLTDTSHTYIVARCSNCENIMLYQPWD